MTYFSENVTNFTNIFPKSDNSHGRFLAIKESTYVWFSEIFIPRVFQTYISNKSAGCFISEQLVLR